MVNYPDKIVVQPIAFGGLDSSTTQLTSLGNRSPDLRNVLFTKDGALLKRRGFEVLGDTTNYAANYEYSFYFRDIASDADVNLLLASRTASVGVVAMMGIYAIAGRYAAHSAFSKTGDGKIIPLSNDAVGECSSFKYADSTYISTAVGAYTDEAHAPGTAGSWTYIRPAFYCVSKNAEPMVIFPKTSGGTYQMSAISSDASKQVYVTFAASIPATFTDGMLICPDLTGYDASEFYAFHKKTYHGTPKSGSYPDTEFYLKEASSSSATSYGIVTATTASATLAITTNATVASDTSVNGCTRWPRGVYDAAVGVRGYPKRWDDVTGGNPWTTFQFPRLRPDWPSGFEIIGDSLEARGYAWGFREDPERVDFSQLGAPYNFLRETVLQAETGTTDAPGIDGGYFYANRGDNDPVVAVRRFQDYIVVFKHKITMLYKGTPGSTDDPLYLVKTIPVGAVHESGIAEAGNDLFFWSYSGPRRLSTVTEYGDVRDYMIAKRLRAFLPYLNVETLPYMVTRINKELGYIAWHLPFNQGSATRNNLAFVYLYELDEWTIFDGPGAEISAYCEVVTHDTPRTYRFAAINASAAYDGGSSRGLLVDMDSGYADGENWGGSAYTSLNITSYYLTRWFNFGDPSLAKRVMSTDLFTGANGFSGSLGYGIDYDPTIVSGSTLESVGTPVSSDGYYRIETDALSQAFRFKISDESTSDFEVNGLMPNIRVRGDRG